MLKDKLDTILEYVTDMPLVREEVRQVHTAVNETNGRLTVIEHVVKDHESEIKGLKNQTYGRLVKALLTSRASGGGRAESGRRLHRRWRSRWDRESRWAAARAHSR